MRHQPLAPLLAVAHGSRDPRAAATVEELLDLVRRESGLRVATSYLDHAAPTPAQALGALTEGADPVVVLPLLLTAAYHSKIDIPRALGNPTFYPDNLHGYHPDNLHNPHPDNLHNPHPDNLHNPHPDKSCRRCANPVLHNHDPQRLRPRQNATGDSGPHGATLRIGGTLGPHPLLTDALERRLTEAGVELGDPDTAVVIVAAGSSDAGANATIASMAREWRRRGWFGAVAAYASAASPTPAEAVRALRSAGAPRVVVASYFLAPGYFADKVRAESLTAGATAVSEVLGAAPEIAKLITLRYAEALDIPARAAVG